MLILQVNSLVMLCILSATELLQVYSKYFCFWDLLPKKTILCHYGRILCNVVKCGLDILEVFENPYDCT
jgi:hypothetical protein